MAVHHLVDKNSIGMRVVLTNAVLRQGVAKEGEEGIDLCGGHNNQILTTMRNVGGASEPALLEGPKATLWYLLASRH